MRTMWDLIIIGAGPAGMSAAIEARKHGLEVLVLDRQSEPGGQIYRSVGSSAMQSLLGPDYAAGLPLVQRFAGCGALSLSGANVWHVAPGRVCYSLQGQSHCVEARCVLLATGAMERPVPVPGWTLPGVMGAGAADVLLKSAGLLPEGPVVLCGNGPLMLQSAAHLAHFNIPVAGVVFTGRPDNALRALPHALGALARPLYMLHGMSLAVQAVRSKGCVFGARRLRIEERDGGLAVRFWTGGVERTLEGSVVLLHEGVISESRITRMARCEHVWNASQRSWHVAADTWGCTSVRGIRTAGDVASVRGAMAAQASGHVVALDICRELGKLTLAQRDRLASGFRWQLWRAARMQPLLDAVFAPNPEALVPEDDTIVCRCEELTAGELRRAAQAGCFSPDSLKSQVRPGMGTCQGRMCGNAVAELIAHTHGIPLERLAPYTAQPPLFPLRLGELADMSVPPDAL